MTASEVSRLLALRHANDVFVPECNLGSAHRGCRRLDAWVMLRTWAPVTTIGYEIKVQRPDWFRDRKWLEYLEHVHEFYVVAPRGIVELGELPEGVGLLEVPTTGSRLRIKRKAHHRKLVLPNHLVYILMSRTRIVAGMGEANEVSRAHFWRKWLESRELNRQLGYEVSEKIRELVAEYRREAQQARYQVAEYKRIQQLLAGLGLPETATLEQLEAVIRANWCGLRADQVEALSRVEVLSRQLTSAIHAIKEAI